MVLPFERNHGQIVCLTHVRNSLSKNCGVSVCVVSSECSEWAYHPETDHSRTRTRSAGARNSYDTGARCAALLQHSGAGPTITQKTRDGVASAAAADAASDTTTLAGVASAGGHQTVAHS